ncbi:elongation factor P maturation arginine rhamnosyltransferase EarP [Simiduia aestuariiviva]|uniref:Protein-arginine rhamnosyltransferase n=1 Tax=Simiduia aestuariiviva TaxID=1510459 RepID=A0A839UGT0_9GAMM|nr:elongation factor P maturation arginine rhamnosyltransferase EarP [Simiduia aestuariiviva]MBB3167254.1 putative repeat protein (TIGR03837 family) [Simiduia aestuariiviva]
MNIPQNWHIFCRVIDNFGDIGVCWRLSRQLAHQFRRSVTLWVDDLHSFQALCEAVDPTRAHQCIDAVQVRHWQDPLPHCEPADVVIEAFGCHLPEDYIRRMTRHRPLWINLEYLSAEAWVKDYHLNQSPVHGLRKTFFFPGFEAGTGGLLWEPQLQELAHADDAARNAWRQQLGLPESPGLTVSLFAYENAALPDLLQALAEHASPCTLAVPQGRMGAGVAHWLGHDLAAGDRYQRNGLTLVGLPFLQQPEYDQLLALCDLNFVRGEDSFVRTQMLGRPFVWHIYPQEESAHLAKLDAFLSLYTRDMPSPLAASLHTAHQQWNQPQHTQSLPWQTLLEQLPSWRRHALSWREKLQMHGDLASNIVHFCTNQV